MSSSRHGCRVRQCWRSVNGMKKVVIGRSRRDMVRCRSPEFTRFFSAKVTVKHWQQCPRHGGQKALNDHQRPSSNVSAVATSAGAKSTICYTARHVLFIRQGHRAGVLANRDGHELCFLGQGTSRHEQWHGFCQKNNKVVSSSAFCLIKYDEMGNVCFSSVKLKGHTPP